jgi:hypothetical protein
MKNRAIQSVLIFSVIFNVIISLYSCRKEDNPVISNSSSQIVIDSILFNWHIDTIIGTTVGNDLYIADTNKIFLPGGDFGIFLDKGILKKIYYRSNDPSFIANCVNGANENNVFFGGSSIATYKPKMKKWNGNLITNIDLPNDTCTSITKILIISDVELWIATSSNHIYHYFNSQIITYKLDSGLTGGYICKDGYGNIYAPFGKHLSNESTIQYLFKYEFNKWEIVYVDTVSNFGELSTNCGSINGFLIREGYTGYYYFTGNSWLKYLNTGINLRGIRCGGSSFNDILFNGEENGYGLMLYYYNGNQIFRQQNYYLDGKFIHCIDVKYGKYFYSTYDFDNNETYVGIGTFKKHLKIF